MCEKGEKKTATKGDIESTGLESRIKKRLSVRVECQAGENKAGGESEVSGAGKRIGWI